MREGDGCGCTPDPAARNKTRVACTPINMALCIQSSTCYQSVTLYWVCAGMKHGVARQQGAACPDDQWPAAAYSSDFSGQHRTRMAAFPSTPAGAVSRTRLCCACCARRAKQCLSNLSCCLCYACLGRQGARQRTRCAPRTPAPPHGPQWHMGRQFLGGLF